MPHFLLLALGLISSSAVAADLPDAATVQKELRAIVTQPNGDFGLHMWATLVGRDGRDGTMRVVTFSGEGCGDQWPGSRVISAQKAFTANAFSLPKLALSTGRLYFAVQPGGSLFGLQHSNPVDATAAYAGKAENIGTAKGPLVGKWIGGVNVFGDGLALYAAEGARLGGLGLSGDSSVADHIIAWKLRHALGLDHLPGGVSPTGDDNLVIDTVGGTSASGWGHAATTEPATARIKGLPAAVPVAKAKRPHIRR